MKRIQIFNVIFFQSAVLMLAYINQTSAQLKPQTYEVYLQGFGNCPGKQSMIDASSLSVTKVNRTALSIDGSVKVAADLPDDTTVSVKAYMQTNSRYSNNPISSVSANICQFIRSDNLYWSIMQGQTNLPNKCPFTKGLYRASGAVVNVVKMPTMLPLGCWKMELSFQNSQNKEIGCIYGIAKVTPQNKGNMKQCSSA